jgi:hypothetical protein
LEQLTEDEIENWIQTIEPHKDDATRSADGPCTCRCAVRAISTPKIDRPIRNCRKIGDKRTTNVEETTKTRDEAKSKSRRAAANDMGVDVDQLYLTTIKNIYPDDDVVHKAFRHLNNTFFAKKGRKPYNRRLEVLAVTELVKK